MFNVKLYYWSLRKMQARGTSMINVAAVVLIAVIGIGGFAANEVGEKASNMTARWVCPCVYVEGHDLDKCMNDMAINTARITRVELHDDQQAVVATSLFIKKSRAYRVEGQGCRMDP